MITQTIGRKLRQYRQKQGYSQEALADRAGLHPTYIGQVERGEKNITVETLGKITAALEIPITAVFEELPQPAAPSEENYPLKAYQILATLPEREQAKHTAPAELGGTSVRSWRRYGRSSERLIRTNFPESSDGFWKMSNKRRKEGA